MPLTEYNGPANSPEIFKHLVGETIAAAFQNDDGNIVIVCGSGEAIEFGSIGGESGPSYWPLSAGDVKELVKERSKAIRRQLEELRKMPGVELP